MPATRSPEATFLLHCLRWAAGSSPEHTAELHAGVTDWPGFNILASRHGVTPLVSEFCQIPGSRERVVQSLSLSSELLRVLELLEHNSIPAVAFKGPALALWLYGDVGLRESCDLDVLIRREDALKVRDALTAQGYVTDLPVRPAAQKAYLRARHELHFTAASGIQIEIHQAFLAPHFSFAFDYKDLWNRLQRRPFCGREILALPAEDLLLALCAHGAKHCWTRLNWICDIARLLRVCGGEFDWRRVMRTARSLGASRMLLLGVRLANQLLGAPAPAEVLRKTDTAAVIRLARRVEQRLFAEDDATPQGFDEHRFFLQTRERLRDKFLYCTRLCFAPTEEDHASLPLPTLFSPLYYPLHAVRVFRKYGLASLKSFL